MLKKHIKAMLETIQSFTANGYKLLYQFLSNDYVQIATQNLSLDFVLMAIFVEIRKRITK